MYSPLQVYCILVADWRTTTAIRFTWMPYISIIDTYNTVFFLESSEIIHDTRI